jgi:PAS domain S-box-containing protein
MAPNNRSFLGQPEKTRISFVEADGVMKLRMLILKRLAHIYIFGPKSRTSKNVMNLRSRKRRTAHDFHVSGNGTHYRSKKKKVESSPSSKDESKRRLFELIQNFQHLNNPLIILNRSGFIEWVNQSFTILSGYSLQESIGHRWVFFRKGHELINLEESALKGSNLQQLTFEYKNTTKAGDHEYWTLATITTNLNSEGIADRLIVIESDITALKKRELDLKVEIDTLNISELNTGKAFLEQSEELNSLKKIAESKRKSFSHMTHEIRTPLNGIIGLTEFLLKAELTSEQRELLNAIKNSGDGLLVVINDALELSRLESGKAIIHHSPFDLSKMLTTVLNIFQTKAFEKSVGLRLNSTNSFHESLIGDAVRLKQILMNLISNAIKFTPKGEVVLYVDEEKIPGNRIRINFNVTDTGVGIPESELSNIFDEFTQLHQAPDVPEGSGLGLAITKQLVEQLGGQITVKSSTGNGSSFKVSLDFNLPAANSYQADEVITEPEMCFNSSRALKKLRILLVDDNKVNLIFGQKILLNEGAFVDLAENGEDALSKLEKDIYDIVLLDIRMPLMDGYDTVNQIRKSQDDRVRKIPILVLSASDKPGKLDKCGMDGINAYLAKPYTAKELFEGMNSAFKQAERTVL